jgi:predicted transcriptional regulator
MTTLSVRVQDYENVIAKVERKAALAAEGKAVETGSTYSFPSWDMLHRTLAPTRIEIIRAMAGQGPMTVREVARRVGRDVKNVHADLDMLSKNGIIDKTAEGVTFPYDRIHIEFDIEAAA